MGLCNQKEIETEIKNNFCDPENCNRTFIALALPNVTCEICKEKLISWKKRICDDCSKKYNKCMYCSKISNDMVSK